MNKVGMGIMVTGIPLVIAMGAVLAWYTATGGILSTMSRLDSQIPLLSVIPVTVETIDGVDKLVNRGKRTNPDFASSPFAILRLELTNNGRTTHNIMVSDSAASTDPITSGEIKLIDIVYAGITDMSYQSANSPD